MTDKLIDPIFQRLDTLAQSSPELKSIAALYKSILPILRDAQLPTESIELAEDQARAKLESGLPLLHEIDLAFDAEAICNLMVRSAQAIEQVHVEPSAQKHRLPFLFSSSQVVGAQLGDDVAMRATAAQQIRLALEQNKIDMNVLLPHVATGDGDFITALASSLRLEPGLLLTISQNAFKPAMRQWSKQLAPLARGVVWNRGYCLVCGASPTLGEFQGNDQEKHLRCGSCGADWQFERIRCACCGNDDHKTLSYLYPQNDKEKMRVEICDQCNGYLKVISAFEPTPVELLAVEDLATLHLDYIAQERGYARVPVQ